MVLSHEAFIAHSATVQQHALNTLTLMHTKIMFHVGTNLHLCCSEMTHCICHQNIPENLRRPILILKHTLEINRLAVQDVDLSIVTHH